MYSRPKIVKNIFTKNRNNNNNIFQLIIFSHFDTTPENA